MSETELAGPQAILEQKSPGEHTTSPVPLHPGFSENKAREILPFHRPCQTQALTCIPQDAYSPGFGHQTSLAQHLARLYFLSPCSQLPQQLLLLLLRGPHLCWAVRTTPMRVPPLGCPECWVCATSKGAHTYLHLSSFILLEHKAEDVIVRPSQQAQVQGAISDREFLEEHCKPREGVRGSSRKRGAGAHGGGWDRPRNADMGWL